MKTSFHCQVFIIVPRTNGVVFLFFYISSFLKKNIKLIKYVFNIVVQSNF